MLNPFYCLFLLLSPLLLLQVAGGKGTNCSRLNRTDLEGRLSTKTPYRSVANYDETPPQYAGRYFP